MLLSLMEACDYPRYLNGSAHAVDAVARRLSIIRKSRIAGHAALADRMASRLENIFLNMLLTDSARVGLSQSLRAFQSSETLPFCPACEAACSKVESLEDLSRLLLHDCPCRSGPFSTASEAATAASGWAPADRVACSPGITGGADVASVGAIATRSEHFATAVAANRCFALPNGFTDVLSAAEPACPPTVATAESSAHWSRGRVIHLFRLGCLLRLVPRRNSTSCHPETANELTALDAPIASRQEAALMPSAALTLPGNADGDARVNDDSICDPLQGSLTFFFWKAVSLPTPRGEGPHWPGGRRRARE
jgi:hypothetical protein